MIFYRCIKSWLLGKTTDLDLIVLVRVTLAVKSVIYSFKSNLLSLAKMNECCRKIRLSEDKLCRFTLTKSFFMLSRKIFTFRHWPKALRLKSIFVQ